MSIKNAFIETELTQAQIEVLTNQDPKLKFTSSDTGIFYYVNHLGIPTPITFNLGNYLYVSVNGNNATAEKGNISRPWRDPWAAKDAAVSGDQISVFAGEYTTGGIGTGADIESDGSDLELTSLWKDGVSYYFDSGAILRSFNRDEATKEYLDLPFFNHDSVGGPESCQVSGFGEFYSEYGIMNGFIDSVSGSGGAANSSCCSRLVYINNPDAVFVMEGNVIGGADLTFWVDNVATINVVFKKGIRGWRELLLSAASNEISSYIFDSVDASVRDAAYIIANDTLYASNATKAITNVRPNNGNFYLSIGSLYKETSSAGLTNGGGGGTQENTKLTIDIGNYIMKNVYTLHAPNTPGIGDLTWTGVPADGDTVTIGAKVYTFRTAITPTSDGEVLIGASAVASRDNLKAAINRESPRDGVLYGDATPVNADVRAASNGNDLRVYARIGGLANNSIATTETSANISWGAGTLLGGLDDGAYDGTALDYTPSGAAVFSANNSATMAGSTFNINIENYNGDFGLMNFNSSNPNDFQLTFNINNCLGSTICPQLFIVGQSSAIGSALGANVIVSGNYINLGGPVIRGAGANVPTTDEVSFQFSGRYETREATSPVIDNDLAAGINEIVLSNAKLITGHTESISNTNAQSYRIMNVYSNAARDGNTTELIEAITTNPNVI